MDMQPIAPGSTQAPYTERTLVLPVSGRTIIYSVFNYFRILSFSSSAGGNSGLVVRFGRNGVETPYTGEGIGLKFDEVYDQVELINNGGAAILTVTVALALGTIHDDRLSTSGTVTVDGEVRDTSQFAQASQVSVSTVATAVHAITPSARSIEIDAGTLDVYIGNTAAVTTANGFLIRAGESKKFYTTYQLFAIRAAGTANVFIFEEVYT